MSRVFRGRCIGPPALECLPANWAAVRPPPASAPGINRGLYSSFANLPF